MVDCVSSMLNDIGLFPGLTEKIRAKLQSKVRTANRASFADRFIKMCSLNTVDLSDLRPMVGGKESLSAVRNAIVHGHVFPERPGLVQNYSREVSSDVESRENHFAHCGMAGREKQSLQGSPLQPYSVSELGTVRSRRVLP